MEIIVKILKLTSIGPVEVIRGHLRVLTNPQVKTFRLSDTFKVVKIMQMQNTITLIK